MTNRERADATRTIGKIVMNVIDGFQLNEEEKSNMFDVLDDISEYQEQIEKMKCCYNCSHYSTRAHCSLEPSDFNRCIEGEHRHCMWELGDNG